MVSEYLGEAGYRAQVAPAGGAGLEMLGREPFDALVLDLMLPDMDGLEVCRRLRGSPDSPNAALPILMLTARGDATDRIVGLELGADDYLPKPFEPRELLARLRAVLRRSGAAAAGTPKGEVVRFGRLEVDRGAREVRLDGQACVLTSYQFALLAALADIPDGCCPARRSWTWSRASRSRRSTARSTCTSRVSARRSRPIRRSREGSSPCAGRGMCSRRCRIEGGVERARSLHIPMVTAEPMRAQRSSLSGECALRADTPDSEVYSGTFALRDPYCSLAR